MAERIQHSTFTIERDYSAPPEKVFEAFSDPAKKRRWFAEGPGFHVDSYELDFRVGGWERSRFRFVANQPLEEGTRCTNDTVFLNIVENERIIIAYTMTIDGAPISSSQSSMEFVKTGAGTRLVFTEQAAFLEGADGPEMREQGTRELLDALAQEVENTVSAH